MERFRRALGDRRGASIAEYALLLVAVLLVSAGAYRILGPKLGLTTEKAGAEIAGGHAGGSAGGGEGVAAGGAGGVAAPGGGGGGGAGAAGGGAGGAGAGQAVAGNAQATQQASVAGEVAVGDTVGGDGVGGAHGGGAVAHARAGGSGGATGDTDVDVGVDRMHIGRWLALLMAVLGLVAGFFVWQKSRSAGDGTPGNDGGKSGKGKKNTARVS